VGDTVFSAWHGRNYIRRRVTPSNPQTTDQTTQRNRLKYAVAAWQDLNTDIKERWGEYATPYQMSGYNQFCNYNIPAMKHADDEDLIITPPNSDVAGPSDMAGATGSGAGEIDVTWSEGATGAGVYIEIWVAKEGTTFYEEGFVVADHENTLASAGSATISGLTAGATYAVMACIYDSNASDDKFSQGYCDLNVTAHA